MVDEAQRTIRSYRDLDVWSVAMDLAAAAYLSTRSFPREELFGLTSQIRRSASSIPANIAEGFGRGQRRSFSHFLRIAQGSLKELETHLALAVRVEAMNKEQAAELEKLCDRIGRMLRNLILSLESPKSKSGPK